MCQHKEGEYHLRDEQGNAVLKGDVGEGERYLLRVLCRVGAAVWGGVMEAYEGTVRPATGVSSSEDSSDVVCEEVAGSKVPRVGGGSGAADSGVSVRVDVSKGWLGDVDVSLPAMPPSRRRLDWRLTWPIL